MAKFLEHLTVWNGLLLVGGVLLAGVGLLRLRHGRMSDAGTEGGQSVPTVLAQGIASLVLAYHLIAWGLNSAIGVANPSAGESAGTWTGLLCVPPRWWWALILMLGALVGLSRAIDTAEAKKK